MVEPTGSATILDTGHDKKTGGKDNQSFWIMCKKKAMTWENIQSIFLSEKAWYKTVCSNDPIFWKRKYMCMCTNAIGLEDSNWTVSSGCLWSGITNNFYFLLLSIFNFCSSQHEYIYSFLTKKNKTNHLNLIFLPILLTLALSKQGPRLGHFMDFSIVLIVIT